jgi:Fe-S cluster biosynthesis and repair protein YggX
MKPLAVYSKIAKRAWVAFQKDDDEVIDFNALLKLLDYSEIFLVDAQARRYTNIYMYVYIFE